MRHASSPRRPPDFTQANADNPEHERQLDLSGRLAATAMGAALRELQIPVGSVLASPAYRALETVRYARFGSANTYPQLDDFEPGSAPDLTEPRTAWLRVQTAVRPATGMNTIIVTHLANISAAFPQYSEDLADGEALIFQPDGRGASPMIRRIKIEEWQKLTAPR
jgi:phosphohistidine phosphatase SixA